MKPVVQQGILSGLDDWVFLATLYDLGEANKKDLIKASLTEVTTGLDIIRRLVKHGIFKEQTDPHDRRAKRLTVTEKGRKLMQETVAKLEHIPDIMPNLTETEQTYLISILESLDRYHTQTFDKYEK